jgi:hypothetical protein
MNSISSEGSVRVKKPIERGGQESSSEATAHFRTSAALALIPFDPLGFRLREIVETDKPMLSPLSSVSGSAVLAKTYKPSNEARAALRPAYSTPSPADRSRKSSFSSLVSTEGLGTLFFRGERVIENRPDGYKTAVWDGLGITGLAIARLILYLLNFPCGGEGESGKNVPISPFRPFTPAADGRVNHRYCPQFTQRSPKRKHLSVILIGAG